MSTVLLAVAGQAEIDLENVDALLSDYLGDDDEVFFLFPATNDSYSNGLGVVVEWANEANISYGVVFDPKGKPNRKVKALIDGAEETVPLEDGLSADLIDLLVTSDDDQKAILLLVGDDIDDLSYSLAESGHEADLPVLDLSAGLDEVVIAEVVAVEPEPEPEIVKPARRSRKAAKPADEPEPADLPHDQHAPGQPQGIPSVPDQLRQLANQLTELAEKIQDGVLYQDSKQRGVPRSTDPTNPYFKHEDGRVTKRGRGRPPKGAEVVYLTDAEAADLGVEE